MSAYDALIKFRCHQMLIDRLERLAIQARRPFPDFLRVILEDYADAEEKRLGLAPKSPDEEEKYLRAAEEPTPYKTGKLSRTPAKQKPREKN